MSKSNRDDEKARLLEQVFDQSREGLAVADLEGNLLFVNSAFAAMHGYTPNALAGKKLSIFHSPDQMETVTAANRQMLETGEFKGEIWHTRRDGSKFPSLMHNTLIRDQKGRPVAMLGTIHDITELKKSERAVRESEAWLRTLIESLPFDFFALDETGRYVMQNSTCRRNWGNVIGMKPEDVAPDLKTREVWNSNNRRAFNGEVVKGEVSYMVGGEERWAYNILSPISSGDRIIGLLGVNIDITAQKRTEEALRRERDFSSAVLSTAGALVVVLDKKGRIIGFNTACERLTGYTFDEVNGRSLWDLFIAPEEADGVRGVFDNLLAGLFPNEYENDWLDREGGRHRISWSNTAILDREGDVEFVIGTGADITERKRAERALRESEERFREMAENILDVFWLFDWNERRVIYASPAYEEIWGRPVQDLYERYDEWAESIHPEDRAQAQESFERIAQSGGGEFREYRIVRPDGGIRLISDRGFAIRNKGGRVQRIAGVAVDITERKRIEEERRRLEERVRQAQKLESLGVLAGGIAHDFNNLLVGILGNADLAYIEMDLSSLARDYVIDIRKAAHRAAELCKHMLDYSGKSRLTVKALNLNRVIDDMVGILESSLPSGITLSRELSESVPFIEADPVQIRQVVMNLITNAAEAIEDEKGEIRLRTGFADVSGLDISRSVLGEHLPDGRYPFVEVSDTGCGMEPDVQSKIFEPFFTTKFTGRGMGLASVIGIVRGHGGAIVVNSKPGEGSTFQVFFPHRGRRADPEGTGGPSERLDGGGNGT